MERVNRLQVKLAVGGLTETVAKLLALATVRVPGSGHVVAGCPKPPPIADQSCVLGLNTGQGADALAGVWRAAQQGEGVMET